MTEREHVLDALAAYALEALDATERARVDAHVATCETCAAELMECRAVVGALPLGLTPVPPPADAWTTILAGARRQRARTGRWRRVAQWSVAAALVAGLAGWNVSLQRELWRYSQGPQVEKLARRPAQLVILAGTARPQASARLFAAVDGRSGHMAVSGLAPLSAGRVYQLWFLRTSAPPAGAATFTVDADGRAWVVVSVPAPLEETRAIVVTEEPTGGSPTPTGAPLLEARAWR